ncbi:MAG: ECF transporter S component [Oscillospiraceae bacterium]|nr:ECF transporter S component [Oscillospiraceae bacterium]
MNNKIKKLLRYSILLLAIPAVILPGVTVFKDRQYAFISLAVVLLACVPFFLSFERRKGNGKLLILIAVMAALSSLGRFVFAAVPGFKPVTALVVITAIYFGAEAGFMTGALSALVSNFYFGQGPWTPFQMFSWGLLGLIAGLLAGKLRGSRTLLLLYGVLAGAAYSLMMDTWSTLWMDGTFSLARYAAYVAASLPWMAIYAASNVVFLLIFGKAIGQILERLKYKYGIGEQLDERGADDCDRLQ